MRSWIVAMVLGVVVLGGAVAVAASRNDGPGRVSLASGRAAVDQGRPLMYGPTVLVRR